MGNVIRLLNEKRSGLHISLSIKLLAAFALVVAVAATPVAVYSRRSATNEFARFIRENWLDSPDHLVSRLAALYEEQGSWTGATELLREFNWASVDGRSEPSDVEAADAPDMQRTVPLILVDAQGFITATNWLDLSQGRLLEPQSLPGRPIEVDGESVGKLIVLADVRPPPGLRPDRLSPEGEATLRRVQRAIIIAGLSAGGLALVVAGVLSWGLVRPLQRLKSAAEGIARGDLSQRVPVSSKDEVGELAATFNHMATELERAENLRRNMTADVAHELRTPLSVVRGKLEGVLDGVYPATPEHLRPILEATEVLTYLVEDLRLLAQAEAGRLILEPRVMDVGDLLGDVRVNFEPQASDRDVGLNLDLPPDLPKVVADWRRVVQVLSNLMSNALRHTPEGGRVTLSAAADDGTIKITVSDTGPGIPAEDLPYVFDRFWRGEKSRSRAGGGTGLGLAIAKKLVELHGGGIGVESTPGQGAAFWFTLPAA
jgi:two-component system sensor histidine kinase BaeS